MLPTNLGLAFILMYAVVFLPFDPVSKALLLPIEPTQLLWINLVAAVALFRWEYDLQTAVEREPLAEAQTMAVTTVIMFQIYYVLMSRSLNDPIRAIGYFSNPWVFVGIGITLALQAAFVYAPPLQAVFGTAALEPAELGLSALTGLIVVPVILFDKWLSRSRRTQPQTQPASG